MGCHLNTSRLRREYSSLFKLYPLYRCVVSSRFREMIEYCNKYQEKIPLSFILGFYVTAVMGRWWEQFNSLPWPSRLALMLTSHIRGQDDRSRLIRRTIIRYMCLGYVMTMTSISVPVRKRFPTVNHIVEAGT